MLQSRSMEKDLAVRWVPEVGLPELPLSAFDLWYEAPKRRLTVRAYYNDISELGFPQFKPPIRGLVIAFNAIEAFKAYEEFTDTMYGEGLDVPRLADDVPYGGTWGFIEMLGSTWLERLADRNQGFPVDWLSHWVIKTHDMVLHVAAKKGVMPLLNDWLDRTDTQ